MKPYTVSVIISSYNYERYVVEAVESALAQGECVLEVVVVDDGSRDRSVEVLRNKFGTHNKVRIIAKENGGQLSAWIAAAGLIQGDIVALMDSDDYWKPGYLDRLLREYHRDTTLDFVYGNMQRAGVRNELMHSERRDRDLGISILMGAFIGRWQGSATSAITLKRSLFQSLVDLPPELAREWTSRPDDCLVCGADILGAHKYYVAEALVVHREHESNALLSYGDSPVKRMRYAVRYERMLDLYRQRMGVQPRWTRMAKQEFRTKSQPSFSEMLHYASLVGLAQMDLLKNLEHRFVIFGHYLRRLFARR